jgi:hypothetical protein
VQLASCGFAAAVKLSAREASGAVHTPEMESALWRGQECGKQMLVVCLLCGAVEQHHAECISTATSVAGCSTAWTCGM